MTAVSEGEDAKINFQPDDGGIIKPAEKKASTDKEQQQQMTPSDESDRPLKKQQKNDKKRKSDEQPFIGSVDFGENYYDLFNQNRTLFQFKTPAPSRFFQQPREMPRPVVLGAVDVVESFLQRVFYELFSIVRFGLALVVTLLTEVLKLVVRGLIQPIIVGFITIMGSHLLQPFLVSVFNYILQPYLSFVNNVLQMIQQTLQPWFMMIGQLLGKLSGVLRSFRLIEINTSGRGC